MYCIEIKDLKFMYKKYFNKSPSIDPQLHNFKSQTHFILPKSEINLIGKERFENEQIKVAQNLVSKILNISNPSQVNFYCNSNEALSTIFSDLASNRKLNVLTSDSEFFNLLEFEKLNHADICFVPTLPFDNFIERVLVEINKKNYDVIFLSKLFFNSGFIIQNIEVILHNIDINKTKLILDGNRAFMNIPLNLSSLENQIYFFSESFHYWGNKLCILTSPLKIKSDPLAPITNLINVLKYMENENLEIHNIHSHIKTIQNKFRAKLLELDHFYLSEKNILSLNYDDHGHFYAFALPSSDVVEKMVEYLQIHKILVEQIGSRLIFHFGPCDEENFNWDFLKSHRKL